jgi:hypothetical protein
MNQVKQIFAATATLALAMFLSGSIAHAEIRESELTPILSCQDARDVAVGGVEVIVYENTSEVRTMAVGHPKLLTAVVNELSIGGANEISRFEKVTSHKNMQFNAKNFKLVLVRESAARPGAFDARLEGRVGLNTTMEGGAAYDLICSPMVHTLLPVIR